MIFKNYRLSFLTLALSIITSNAFAQKMTCSMNFELSSFENTTFLSMMKTTLAYAMEEVSAAERKIEGKKAKYLNQEKAIENQNCVGLQLDSKNFTWHVNYEKNDDKSGRSYGLGPGGKRSDPSDKFYLTELAREINTTEKEMKEFYSALIEVLANSDASGFSDFSNPLQVVATDFVAVYVAEQKRQFISKSKWDDALLQVTLLAAFHAGQKIHTQYYDGEFTSDVYDQRYHVYKQPAKKETLTSGTRQAELYDYWQFTSNPAHPNWSGINLTRGDFSKMGTNITQFERVNNKTKLERIEKLIGKKSSKNIYSDLAVFFTRNDVESMSEETADLADAISDFMIQTHKDAEAITAYIKKM